MTREELREHCEKQVKACEMWAKSREQEPSGKVYEEHKLILELLEERGTSDDCVSRQAVFETIDDCNSDGLKGIFCSYDDGERFKEYIKKLPPVTPTFPKGATNGDMIKAMFPQYIYEKITYKVCISENEWKPSKKVIRMKNGEHSVDFDLDWWDAPCKGVMKMVAINVEMPKCCGKCKFGQRFNPDEDICRIDGHIIKSTFETITQNRDEKCPLIGIEERKVGKWIGEKGYPICEKCGCNIYERYIGCSDYAEIIAKMDYCPNCGSKMSDIPTGSD